MNLSITIPGPPVAKKRPRFARRGKFVTVFNCQETEEGKIRWEMKAQAGDMKAPRGVPVALHVGLYMPIPASWSKKKQANPGPHVSKPDIDNMLKTIKDCGNGVLWDDDSQINFVRAGKAYSDDPRTLIDIFW